MALQKTHTHNGVTYENMYITITPQLDHITKQGDLIVRAFASEQARNDFPTRHILTFTIPIKRNIYSENFEVADKIGAAYTFCKNLSNGEGKLAEFFTDVTDLD